MRFGQGVVEDGRQLHRQLVVGPIDHRLGERQRLDPNALHFHRLQAQNEVDEFLLQRARVERTHVDDRSPGIDSVLHAKASVSSGEGVEISLWVVVCVNVDRAVLGHPLSLFLCPRSLRGRRDLLRTLRKTMF